MKRFFLIVSCLLLTFALSAQELQDEKESPPRYQGFAAGGDLLTQFALGDYSKFALMNLGGSLAGEYTLPLELPRNMDLGLALRAEFAHVFVKADTALKADEEIRAFGAAWLRIPFMLGNQFFAFQPELGGGLSVFLSKYEIKGESKSNTYLSPLISIAPSFRWIPEPLQKLEVEAAPLFTIVPEKEKATMMLGLRLGAIWHFQLKNETDKEDKKAAKLAKAEEKRQKKETERLEAEEKRRKEEEERLAAEEDKRRKKEEEKTLREEEKRRQEEEKARLEEEAEKAQLAAEEAEKQRLAEEAEKARKAEEERLAAEEAEKQRLADEAEKAHKAEEERLAVEEAEKQHLAEEAEKARLEEEAKRLAEEEAARLAAEEAEKARLAEEAEKARKAEEERLAAEEAEKQRLAEEAEKARKAEEERLAAEEAEKARKAEVERLAAEEAEKQRLEAEAEKARKAAEPSFVTERLGLNRILFFSKNGAVFSGLSREQIRQNEKTIDKAVELIKEHPECKVIIEGYANNISGTEEEDRTACQPLSLWRAEYIKKELIKRGIAADKIETVGKGGANPLASRSNRDNWWKNRRVEFVITYESEVQDE